MDPPPRGAAPAAGRPGQRLGRSSARTGTELDDLRQAREPFAGRIPDWQQTVEASVMDTADDIAYAIHDVEDFYRVGVLQQGAVAAELMAWQRESGHLRAITDAALAAAARRPGAAIERLRRQLHRKDAWIADDDAFAAAVEHVREELVDGLLAMPFDGSIEAEQYVARFSARWTTRFVDAITVTDQTAGPLRARAARPRRSGTRCRCSSSSTTGSCWPARTWPCTSAARPGCWAPWSRRSGSGCSTRRRSPGCPAGCTTWSSWPRRSCTRVPRTGSARARGRAIVDFVAQLTDGQAVAMLDALSGRSGALWTDAFVL